MLLSTKKEESRRRFILIVILILLVCSHFTTLSRAATVSLFIMIFFFLISFHNLRKKFVRNTIITAFILITLFVIVQNERIIDIALQRISSVGQEQSFEERLAWWTLVLNLFTKTIGRGLGIGASYYYLNPAPHIHNIYLSILCDMGFIGFLLFVLFISFNAKKILQVIKYQRTFPDYIALALCGAMLAFLAQGLLDFHYNYINIWLIIGIIMGTLKLAKYESRESLEIK
jgi:O-antigen ligase